MKVVAALLCDAASVRENLLFVMGGGITRLWRAELPAPLGVDLAVMVEVTQREAVRPHEFQVVIQGQDGHELVKVVGAFQVGVGGLEVGETILAPVALQLGAVLVAEHGPYAVEILIDGEHRGSLSFHVVAAQDE